MREREPKEPALTKTGRRRQTWARSERLVLRFTEDEIDWLKHAAGLGRVSLSEYVRRAINAELVKQGVDAVLVREGR